MKEVVLFVRIPAMLLRRLDKQARAAARAAASRRPNRAALVRQLLERGLDQEENDGAAHVEENPHG